MAHWPSNKGQISLSVLRSRSLDLSLALVGDKWNDDAKSFSYERGVIEAAQDFTSRYNAKAGQSKVEGFNRFRIGIW